MKLIQRTIETVYSGHGYTQAMGVTVQQEVVIIFNRFRFVTGIHFLPEGEWTRGLKRRIADDDTQQAIEQARP